MQTFTNTLPQASVMPKMQFTLQLECILIWPKNYYINLAYSNVLIILA